MLSIFSLNAAADISTALSYFSSTFSSKNLKLSSTVCLISFTSSSYFLASYPSSVSRVFNIFLVDVENQSASFLLSSIEFSCFLMISSIAIIFSPNFFICSPISPCSSAFTCSFASDCALSKFYFSIPLIKILMLAIFDQISIIWFVLCVESASNIKSLSS